MDSLKDREIQLQLIIVSYQINQKRISIINKEKNHHNQINKKESQSNKNYNKIKQT